VEDSKNHEVPGYVIFSIFLLLPLSYFQISLPTEPCTQTPSIYISRYDDRPSFTPEQNNRKNYSFAYFNHEGFREELGRQ